MTTRPQSVSRTTGAATAELTWPEVEWDAFPPTVRNRIRDLLDEACDLMNEALS